MPLDLGGHNGLRPPRGHSKLDTGPEVPVLEQPPRPPRRTALKDLPKPPEGGSTVRGNIDGYRDVAGSEQAEPFRSRRRNPAPLDGGVEGGLVSPRGVVKKITQGALWELSIPASRVSDPDAKPPQREGRPVGLRGRA
eukprot:6472576-Alexandrium_andersonii.AAC.1